MLNSADILSDSEKFVIILQKYAHEYRTQQELSEEMGIPKQSISDWKKNSRTIRINNRNSISKTFQLRDMIWIDTFDDAVNFEEKLESYKIISTIDKEHTNEVLNFSIQNIILPIQEITKQEQKLLRSLAEQKEIDLQKFNLSKMSSASLFELAKTLKSSNQISEALEVLKNIQQKEESFKYAHHHKIEHLKAILLSHESLKKWDKSIDILRLLYVENYHIKEPEIITLLASNYKRKALYSSHSRQQWIPPKEIDMNLLSSALLLYREAYEAKTGTSNYYDAINFAYLYNIAEFIEIEQPNTLQVKDLYDKLKKEWVVDVSNWWEVSSNAEFLILLGEVELAKHNITIFLEEQNIESFNVETTLRQLELYLHFTEDSHAKEFYKYLEESWQYIK